MSEPVGAVEGRAPVEADQSWSPVPRVGLPTDDEICAVNVVADEYGVSRDVMHIALARVHRLIAGRVHAEAVAELCDALGEPVETPGDHAGEPPYQTTWERALDIARGRTAVWSDLLRRAAAADAEWLADYRRHGGAAVPDLSAEAVAEERQRIRAELLELAQLLPIEEAQRTSTWLARAFSTSQLAAGSVPVATPPTMDDATLLAKHAAYISRTVTASYPAGLDPELVMRRRVGKIFVESGELGDAIEGWTGENPRKGVYATREDVIKELIDCASASLCAIEYMTGDAGLSVGMVTRQVTGNAQRLSESIEDHCGQPAYPDSVAEPSVGTGTPAEEVSGGSGHAERQEPATWQLDTTSLDADVRTERDEWRELAERACAENERLTAEVARYRAAIDAVKAGLPQLRERAGRVLDGVLTYQDGIEQACQMVEAVLAAALGDGA